MPSRLAHRSVFACFALYYSRLVCRFHVGSRIVSLFHPQRIAHLHLFKKKKKNSVHCRPCLSPFNFFPIEWVRAKQLRLAPGLSLSLSLSLLCTSKETWEHESVVLTTTHTLTQPVHTTHHHRKQVISGPFQSSKNIPSRTHDARGGEERDERDERGKKGRGEKQRSKMKKRTAATRIPAWSPTAVLTSRYRA